MSVFSRNFYTFILSTGFEIFLLIQLFVQPVSAYVFFLAPYLILTCFHSVLVYNSIIEESEIISQRHNPIVQMFGLLFTLIFSALLIYSIQPEVMRHLSDNILTVNFLSALVITIALASLDIIKFKKYIGMDERIVMKRNLYYFKLPILFISMIVLTYGLVTFIRPEEAAPIFLGADLFILSVFSFITFISLLEWLVSTMPIDQQKNSKLHSIPYTIIIGVLFIMAFMGFVYDLTT